MRPVPFSRLLHYTYDPVGNITRIEDRAVQTVFHANQRVDPACDYTYDPLYRLIEATGRENIGQSAFNFSPPHGNYRDYPFFGSEHLNDLQALRNYRERYEYDPVGNFLNMLHRAANGNWSRRYSYEEPSLIEPSRNSNRLTKTTVHSDPHEPTETYTYDANGNITHMPHLPVMQWNFEDQLSATSRQVVNEGEPATTYYVYDGSGQRARKVSERDNGTRKNDRLYFGGFEVFRKFDPAGNTELERQTLHVMDDKQRIALIETKTIDDSSPVADPIPQQKYEFGNHLSSSILELDESGSLITYEEYSPYGTTTYQAGRSAAELSLKRYRYTGKERDEENGFTYHGARYYAPWLGRWTACDPLHAWDDNCTYAYGKGSPTKFVDPNGQTDIVGSLLETAKKAYTEAKDVKVRVFAELGEVEKYWKQGASQWVDPVEKTGRLTEAEHPLAGAALKYLNPKFSYTAAKTIIVQRAVAVAKTVGDIRLIKAVKSGAMGASEFVERSKANFVRAIGNRWAQTGESTAATVIKEARQAVAVTEEAAKEALPVLARSGASRAAQRGFTSVAPMLGIAGAGLDLLLGAGAYKEAKHDVEHKDYARALSSGAGVAASATSLVARGAAAFTGVSSVSLTASVGTFGTGEAIAAAPHVVGAFAVGAAIGVGIQEGSAYLSKKYLGTEISPGQMIGDTLTAVDRKVSGLISDPSKLGWKIANWLTPTSN